MSAAEFSYIKPNRFVGLLYGAQTDDPNLAQGLRAVFLGETSSHIGGKIYFSQDMFEKYIKGNESRQEIPHEVYETPHGRVYAVDINFGPTSGIASSSSRQNLGVESQLASQALSPIRPSEYAIKHGLTEERYIKSPLPILSCFSKRKINVSATTIFHLNQIPKDMLNTSSFAANQSEEQKRILIGKKLSKFATDVEQLETKYFANKADRAFEEYIASFYDAVDNLKKELYPDQPAMSRIAFMQKLDEFASFGLRPEESAFDLVTSENGEENGYSVDKMLSFIRNNFDNAEHTPYNLFTHNCSHFINNMFKTSAVGPNAEELKKPFKIAPEYKVLGAVAGTLPMPGAHKSDGICTPAMLAKQLLKAKNVQQQLHTRSAHTAKTTNHIDIVGLESSKKRIFSRSYVAYNKFTEQPNMYTPIASMHIKNTDTSIEHIAQQMQNKFKNSNVKIKFDNDNNSYNFFINNSLTAIITNDKNNGLLIQYTDMPANNDTAQEVCKDIFTNIEFKNPVMVDIESKDEKFIATTQQQLRDALGPEKDNVSILINGQEYNQAKSPAYKSPFNTQPP